MNTNILGFFGQTNKWTHDHSATLSINGEITDYIHLERVSRKKFDNRIPYFLPEILNEWQYNLSDPAFAVVNTFDTNGKFFKKSDNNIFSSENSIYMLQEFIVKEKYKDMHPAIVHVDGTSRPQIVQNRCKELILIENILKTMYEKYNVHCLINTSFNMTGEPIVHTKEDAVNSAKMMGLDAIIANNELIELKEIRS